MNKSQHGQITGPRRRTCHLAMALVLLGLLAGCAAGPYPQATPNRVADVVARISPAVVRVDIAQAIFENGKQSLYRGNGSGVIIDADGHILTNYHVAGRAVEIYVVLDSRERVPAKLIGDDHWTDLAIIQMDMDQVRSKKIAFSWADLGTSANLRVGQDVMAFGTPYGLARTVTRGSVSNTDRTFYDQTKRMTIDGYETGDFSNWVQMDVPINPGNSGGPLVDMNGRVVGINTRGGGENLNFAIPIDTAKPVIAALLKTATAEQKGHVDRSDLGFELRPLHELESHFEIDLNKGVLVENVDRIGPAQDAGIRSQDILLTVNGLPTNVRFPEELAAVQKMIASLPVGSDAVLTLKRGKETITKTVKSVLLQGLLGEERAFTNWGMVVREVTRPFAVDEQLDQPAGVWITSLAPAGPGDEAELHKGHIIKSVNTVAVKNLADFQRIYDESIKAKNETIMLEVQSGRQVFSYVLDLKKHPATTEPN